MRRRNVEPVRQEERGEQHIVKIAWMPEGDDRSGSRDRKNRQTPGTRARLSAFRAQLNRALVVVGCGRASFLCGYNLRLRLQLNARNLFMWTRTIAVDVLSCVEVNNAHILFGRRQCDKVIYQQTTVSWFLSFLWALRRFRRCVRKLTQTKTKHRSSMTWYTLLAISCLLLLVTS